MLFRSPVPEAAEIVHRSWRIRKAANFGDLVARLLQEEALPEYYVESLDDEVDRLSDDDIRRNAAALRDVAIRRAQLSPYDAVDFIELLGRCGAWEEARLAAGALVEQTADTKAERPRRLRLRSLACAVEIEAAAARADYGAITAATSDWKGIAEEIRKDDEENADARRPFPGLRVPDTND